MFDKIEKNRIIYKIEDFFAKKLRCNDKFAKTIRIQWKKEDETFSNKTEDFSFNIYMIQLRITQDN